MNEQAKTSSGGVSSALKPALLLTLVSLIGGSILAFTEKTTAPVIAEQERIAILKSLRTILPEDFKASGLDENKLLSSTITIPANDQLKTVTDTMVYRAWTDEQPAVAVFRIQTEDGYSGAISLLIGIRFNGVVSGVRVVSHKETPGLGDLIHQDRSNWILGFENTSLLSPVNSQWSVKKDDGAFDQFTGATVSPRAVVGAIHRTLLYFTEHKNEIFESPLGNTHE